VAGVPRDLHGQGQDRRVRGRANSSLCAPTLWCRRRCGGISRLRWNCGLIIRRDSPNGKRFARRGRAGPSKWRSVSISVHGWARSEQFEGWAEDVRAVERALRCVRRGKLALTQF
jgi:Replication protein C N-terminal domain